MKQRTMILCSCAAAGMLILILDGRTALEGVRAGLELCLRTLIPALFPFLILSSLLTGTLVGQPIGILRPVGRLCGIPAGAESLLAAGFLGGYPVGAQSVGQAFRDGSLSRTDAERLLVLCNQAGPSFLFGMVSPLFTAGWIGWMLWGIQIITALGAGILTAEPGTHTAALTNGRCVTFPEAMERSVRSMAMVCGWVVFFRMILEFLNRWFFWMIPAEIQVLICGLLELSNGCVRLVLAASDGLRFLLAGVLLSFGGLCVTMQTASAAAGLSLRRYVPGKLLQCCLSFWMCMLLQVTFPKEQRFYCGAGILIVMLILTAVFLLILRRNKKISSIPATSGV